MRTDKQAKREMERALDHADRVIVRQLEHTRIVQRTLSAELQRIRRARYGPLLRPQED